MALVRQTLFPDSPIEAIETVVEMIITITTLSTEVAGPYEGMVIGNPLMTTYDRALKYLPYFYNQENAIANNRVWAMHTGFKGKITPDLSHRVLFTASRNQGTYTGLYQGRYSWGGVAEDPTFAYPYKNGLWQFYTLVALEQKMFLT